MSAHVKHRLPHRSSPGMINPQRQNGFLRWWQNAFRTWQRRKMIAALSALDDRILLDIGIERANIADVVDRFDDAELRMTPLASEPKSQALSCAILQRAA